MEKQEVWDKRYLDVAKVISTWSRDPSTQVGAVTVGSKGQLLSQGYNGFPRGVEDLDKRYENREEKYNLIVHAEMNTIYNASYSGICLNGASIYIYGLKICNECAKGIIQVGIKRVVMKHPKNTAKNKDKWDEAFKISKTMFKEAGVEFIIKGE